MRQLVVSFLSVAVTDVLLLLRRTRAAGRSCRVRGAVSCRDSALVCGRLWLTFHTDGDEPVQADMWTLVCSDKTGEVVNKGLTLRAKRMNGVIAFGSQGFKRGVHEFNVRYDTPSDALRVGVGASLCFCVFWSVLKSCGSQIVCPDSGAQSWSKLSLCHSLQRRRSSRKQQAQCS